uniref:DUF148 domain-containing protein n=1 Tax=Steinernema glaseri TaxID=37863 RepID=A0A1I7YHF5_9BILA
MLLLLLASLLVSTVSGQSGFPGFPAPSFQAPSFPAPSFQAPSFPTHSFPAPDPTYWRPVQPPPVWNPTHEEFQRSWNTAMADPRSVWNGEAIRAGTPSAELQRLREEQNRADDRNTFAGFLRHSFSSYHPAQYTAAPFPAIAPVQSAPAFPAPSFPSFPGFPSGK